MKYETHACVICGCTTFISCHETVFCSDGGLGDACTYLEACNLCGTVRDKNIVNKRYKEKHHESTDER